MNVAKFSCSKCDFTASNLGVITKHMVTHQNATNSSFYDDAYNNAVKEHEGEELDCSEVIIAEVQNRPILWDHRVSISQRGKEKRDQAWAEVSFILGGQLTPAECAKRWKYLRDRYVRARGNAKQYVHSGSEASPKIIKFKYYEVMSFLSDVLGVKGTTSNITVDVEDSSSSAPSPVPSTSSSAPSPVPCTSSASNKRKKVSLDEAILKELSKPIEVPQQKKIDAVDGFCCTISESLRRLEPRKRAETQIKIMQLLYEAEYN